MIQKFGHPEKIETLSGLTGAARQAYVLGVGATVGTHPPPKHAFLVKNSKIFYFIFQVWQHNRLVPRHIRLGHIKKWLLGQSI